MRNDVYPPDDPARFYRRHHVAEEEPHHPIKGKNHSCEGRQPTGVLLLLVGEAIQSVCQTWPATISQPNYLGGDRDRQLQAQRIKVSAPGRTQVIHQSLALLYHELAIACANDLGRKEARRCTPLLRWAPP